MWQSWILIWKVFHVSLHRGKGLRESTWWQVGPFSLWLRASPALMMGYRVLFPSSSGLGPRNTCSHFTLSWYSWNLPPSPRSSNWSQKLDQPHLLPVYHRQIFFIVLLREKRWLQTSIWLGWKCFRVGTCGKLNEWWPQWPIRTPALGNVTQ